MQEVWLSATSSSQPGQPETGADGGFHPAQVKRTRFGFFVKSADRTHIEIYVDIRNVFYALKGKQTIWTMW